MICLRCFALRWMLLAPVVWSLSGGRADGHTGQMIGGDALNDALIAPQNSGEEGGSAGFVLEGGKWPQPGGLNSHITLTYSFQNMFDGGLKMPNGQPLPNDLIRHSIERALSLWASVVPIDYVEVPDNGLGYGALGAQYGQIRFRHVYINGPDPPPPALPVAKAQAYFPFSGDPYAGDVEYDHGDPWQESGTLPTPDILGATIHELGHTLGLGHTDNPDANMYWIFTRYTGPTDGKLHPDDVAGVQSIYGDAGNAGSVTSLVPEPASWELAIAFAATLASYTRAFRGRQLRSVK